MNAFFELAWYALIAIFPLILCDLVYTSWQREREEARRAQSQ